MDTNKLKMAREYFAQQDRRGSAGRESAEKNRMEKRILRERSGIQGPVGVVPSGQMKMPSKQQMIDEGMMDMANKPNPAFAKEMVKEKKKQQREYAGY